MLRTARRYDAETDAVMFANGLPFKKEKLEGIGLEKYVDSMFIFCRQMCLMGVDNAEYALLTAICIFSGKCVLSLYPQYSAVSVLVVNLTVLYFDLLAYVYSRIKASSLYTSR